MSLSCQCMYPFVSSDFRKVVPAEKEITLKITEMISMVKSVVDVALFLTLTKKKLRNKSIQIGLLRF